MSTQIVSTSAGMHQWRRFTVD